MLKTAVVERAIANSIMAQHHIDVTVTCPRAMPRKTGLAFTCSAALAAGTYPVRVTETNDDGHVRYGNQAPLVVLNASAAERAIARSIQSQRHLSSTVACPSPVLQKAGISFFCTATTSDHHYYRFAVTVVDDSGRVRYVEHR
jgi:Domain of unknown function (DUF4333)